MTIKKLIWKLRKENLKQIEQGKEPNGAYGVLESYYNDMLRYEPKEEKQFDTASDNITGMIWGLRAAFFITAEEKDQLMDEVMQICNKFYGIEEN